MALSNLRNEPRREITEQVIGLVVVIGVLALDLWVASHVETKNVADYVLVAILVPLCSGMAIMVVGFILGPVAHSIGEIACAALAKIGLDLRPRQRGR